MLNIPNKTIADAQVKHTLSEYAPIMMQWIISDHKSLPEGRHPPTQYRGISLPSTPFGYGKKGGRQVDMPLLFKQHSK